MKSPGKDLNDEAPAWAQSWSWSNSHYSCTNILSVFPAVALSSWYCFSTAQFLSDSAYYLFLSLTGVCRCSSLLLFERRGE